MKINLCLIVLFFALCCAVYAAPVQENVNGDETFIERIVGVLRQKVKNLRTELKSAAGKRVGDAKVKIADLEAAIKRLLGEENSFVKKIQ